MILAQEVGLLAYFLAHPSPASSSPTTQKICARPQNRVKVSNLMDAP